MKSLDAKIKRIQASRYERGLNAQENFAALFNDIIEIRKLWDRLKGDPKKMQLKGILQRSAVITMATALEIYFRDSLKLVFELCKPESYEQLFSRHHTATYALVDLVHIQQSGTHAWEILLTGIRFSEMKTVDAVYRDLLGFPLFNAVLLLPEVKDGTLHVTPESFKAVQRILAARHKMIHNPRLHPAPGFHAEHEKDLILINLLIKGCAVVIGTFVAKHFDKQRFADEQKTPKRKFSRQTDTPPSADGHSPTPPTTSDLF